MRQPAPNLESRREPDAIARSWDPRERDGVDRACEKARAEVERDGLDLGGRRAGTEPSGAQPKAEGMHAHHGQEYIRHRRATSERSPPRHGRRARVADREEPGAASRSIPPPRDRSAPGHAPPGRDTPHGQRLGGAAAARSRPACRLSGPRRSPRPGGAGPGRSLDEERAGTTTRRAAGTKRRGRGSRGSAATCRRRG